MKNVLTITKYVPGTKVPVYLNLGWVIDYPDQMGDTTCLSKEVRTNSGIDDRTECKFRSPYLIQRGQIRRPLGKHIGTKLTAAIAMDYMGAAEFEFGALPKAFRRIEAQFMLYKSYIYDYILAYHDDKTYKLRVYANFEDDTQRDQYGQFIKDIIAGKANLKEPTYLEKRAGEALLIPERHDFWWDITNDVLFSFDKQFMSRLPQHLQASFAVMVPNNEE